MPAENAAPSVTVAAVQTTALTRKFGEFTAVDHVALTIAQGEIFGLIGPNGAGKSTLIRMLTTLLPPTSGTASIAGYDIVRDPAAVRRHIGYVPQLLSADGSLTGYENMLLSARLYGVPRRERRERIDRALARMGLSESAGHLAGHYSGGMIRRLEIAQSLLHRPAVLFLDEPTVGLDPGARDTVWERVVDLRDRFHKNVLPFPTTLNSPKNPHERTGTQRKPSTIFLCKVTVRLCAGRVWNPIVDDVHAIKYTPPELGTNCVRDCDYRR